MNNENTGDLLLLAEQVINQSHYASITEFDICHPQEQSEEIKLEDVLCLFKISEIVYNSDDSDSDKLPTVFNALHSCGASCVMILQCVEGHADLYLGAVNKQKCDNYYYLNVIRDILKTSIGGNLPGTEITEIVSRSEIKKIINDTLDNGFDTQCITSVSCVANVSDSNQLSRQGIETILGAGKEKNYSIIVIADPVSNAQIDNVIRGYEEIGTQLSTYENVSVTVQSGNNYTVSENTSQSINSVLSEGISLTQTHSVSGTYKREETQQEKNSNTFKNILNVGISAGTLLVTKDPASALIAGRITSNIIPSSKYEGSDPDSETVNDGLQKGKTFQRQEGKSEQTGHGVSETQTESTSVQSTTKDLHIIELNTRLNSYLKWLNKCRNYGMFNCCTYIISGSASINLFVAGQYQALIQSFGESQQPVSINTWTKENGIEKIRASLLYLVHPTFEDKNNKCFTTGMLLSSKELSAQMALPKKSILGVSVASHASFGVNVVRKTALNDCSLIRLGDVFHMGKNTSRPVLLDSHSLSSHTFIAGTNGSGKSNTVFRLIEELMRLSVPFMVIEPAKGEYKNLFGNEPNVEVYGTNPKKSKILKINPFWFNDDVSVHEHIDKLIEIFNASWSMYAAMPAVLKASIENAYKSCGWDLKTSECLGIKRFPAVKDVLKEFNNKMNSTAFSGEVKGNYVGALSTRMESLCNGIYEEMFSGDDLGDEALFDSNVLIDLSRVGSSETKSMIMGFLIIRLQEYRMKYEAMNLPLQHITILEEAHHILRRTSSVQSSEGTNIVGKSVEMISNLIAEMRSYGEGFIIVDQSPGLMDMSVMRNTNTKIVLRLPEGTDREIVGITIGLNPKQIYELSRLKTGVCAVYQKDWLEPVLCMVDRASHEVNLYKYAPTMETCDNITIKQARGIAFEALIPLSSKGKDNIDFQKLSLAVKMLDKSTPDDQSLSKQLKRFIETKQTREKGKIEPYATIIWNMIRGEDIWDYVFEQIKNNNIEQVDSILREQISKYIQCDNYIQTSIISLFFQKRGAEKAVQKFYIKWTWNYILVKKQLSVM